MSRIDSHLPLAAAMASQLAALRERARLHKPSSGAAAGAQAQSTQASQGAMARRISAIAPDHPDRRQQAVRIFLEGELVREFGDGLLNDPAFGQMLDAVQQQMQDDPQIASAVHALGDHLLAGQPPPRT